MTTNLDTSACRAAQPGVDCSQEALGFFAAPSVVNNNTITEHTTDENYHVAQIDRAWMCIMKREVAKK